MIKKRKNWTLIFLTILLIIIPLVLAITTSYALYLKYKIRNLEIKINELKDEDEEKNVEKTEIHENIKINFEEINKFLNIKPKGLIEKEKVDIFYLIKNSKSSFQNEEKGGITLLNEKDAFFQSISSLEHNKEYFLTKIATNLFSVYSEELNFGIQRVFTVQLRLYLTEEDAFFTTLTLRNAGIPVFVYRGRFQNSGKNYFAICSGLFPDINIAKKYSDNIDEEKVLQLTGLSIKDRFLKSFDLIGVNENEK
ncbi:hypothetical protein JCM30566_01820 [Marinitoga arctica]